MAYRINIFYGLYRLISSILAILAFLIHISLIRVFRKKGIKRRQYVATKISIYCKIILNILNIKLIIKGTVPSEKIFLQASNHCSYIDIIALNSTVSNTCFIVARDVLSFPVIGTIAKHGNSHAIERRNRDHLQEDIQALTDLLNRKMNILFFPEGKCSNGEDVARFKEPLFDSAVRSQKSVVPIALSYLKVNGKKCNGPQLRDVVCWYAGMSFFPHFLKHVFFVKSVDLEMKIGKEIESHGETSTSLSLKTHAAVKQMFTPII